MAHRTRTRRLLGAIGVTALATGTVLATTSLPMAHADTSAAVASVTVRPDPSYKADSFEGWGTSLVWFANATGDYPAGDTREAGRPPLRRRRSRPQHRPLQHRRRQRPRRQGLPAGRRRGRGLVEGPGGHHPRGRRLVERRRQERLEQGRRRHPALVGRPHQERHRPLGDLQQLPAVVHDGERLRLRRLRLHEGPAEGRTRSTTSPSTWSAPPSAWRRRTTSRSTPSTRSTSPTPTTGAPSSAPTASPPAAVRRAPTSAPSSSRRSSRRSPRS